MRAKTHTDEKVLFLTPVPKRAGAADPKSAVAQKLIFAKHATAPMAAAPWQREGHKQTEQDLDNP